MSRGGQETGRRSRRTLRISFSCMRPMGPAIPDASDLTTAETVAKISVVSNTAGKNSLTRRFTGFFPVVLVKTGRSSVTEHSNDGSQR